MALPFSVDVLFGVAMLVIGGVVLAFSLRYVWRATAVYRAVEVSAVGEVDAGALVRVSGAAEQATADVLVAPFSGLACLALGYEVEERRVSPFLLPWFVTLHEATGADAFRVRTPTASVDVVSPTRTVTLAKTVVATVLRGDEPPERVARFEQVTDAVPESTVWRDPPVALEPLLDLLSIGARRYTEQRVTPGDDVTVVGRVTKDGDGIDPLVISDRPLVATLYRMARTSFVGLLSGVAGVLLGVVLLAV